MHSSPTLTQTCDFDYNHCHSFNAESLHPLKMISNSLKLQSICIFLNREVIFETQEPSLELYIFSHRWILFNLH